VRTWSDKTELPVRTLVGWIGIGRAKYYQWKQSYGQVNEHNAWVPRDHWLEDWESGSPGPGRGKIICPRCDRPLSTYTLTKRLGTHAKKTLRYYRCRSTAGGRRPCRGVWYPAWEVEQFVRDQLARVETWQQILGQANAKPSMPGELARLWQAVGQLTQDDLLPAIVGNVRFLERNSRILISLNKGIVQSIKC